MVHAASAVDSEGPISVVRMFEDGTVLESVRDLGEDVAKLAASPLWPLSDSELIASLDAAHRLEQVSAVLKLRLVQQVDGRGIPAAQGHRSTAGWLRTQLLLDPQPARQLAERAATLLNRPAVDQALRDGTLDVAQAEVIATAVNAIPETLAAVHDDGSASVDSDSDSDSGAAADSGPGPSDEQITVDAEAELIRLAGRFPAYQLRRLADRILAHVAPEIAERADEAALLRQEARAHARRSFTLSRPIDGMVRVCGALGVEDAAIVSAALDPLCTPRASDERVPAQRRADALIDVCRLALRTGDLPDNGGEPPQLAVTVPFDPLTRSLCTASVDSGERFSARSVRRLACDARILPIVLGGEGQVLDVGRSRRLAHGALRRALIARDRGCAFPDCDRPPRWCDAHHLRPWSDGGPTSLDNLVLLCRHHHRILHDSAWGWSVRLADDRLPEFVPPPWTDPNQRPRRNLYHPRT